MKLHRNGTNWNRDERNKTNDNWEEIEGNYNNVVENVSDKAFDKVVDASKLNWKDPVDTIDDLPTDADTGETRMVRDTGKIYRYNGTQWQEIQEIDATAINEVDSRLNTKIKNKEDEDFKKSLVNHKKNRKIITWVDDDGHRGVYDKLAPLLRKHTIKMNSAVVTNNPHGFPIRGLPSYDPNSKYMSYTEMEELRNEGIVEFVCHSHTHNNNHRLTDMTTKEMHEELRTNRDIIRTLGWDYKHFVYPFGAYNSDVQDVVRQYFDAAFTTRIGVVEDPLDNYAISRVKLDAPHTASEVIAKIDEADEKDTWIIMTSHVDQYGNLDLDKMEEIIEYALIQGFEFVTLYEGMKNFGNLLQTKDVTISSSGKIHSKKVGIYQNGHMDYETNAPITAFEKGTVTRLKVTKNIFDDYQIRKDTRYVGGYGYIETHRDSTEDVFSYQRYTDTEGAFELKRFWDGNKWSEWINVDNTHFANNPDNPRKPKDYPMFRKTIEKITTPNINSFDLDRSGTIYTERDNEFPFTRQLYIPAETTSSSPKIRYSSVDGSGWGEWFSVPFIMQRYNRVFEDIVVPANSTLDRISQYGTAKKDNYYIKSIKTKLPVGITVDVHCLEDGILTTRIANVTSSSITLNRLEIEVRRMTF